MVIERKSEGPDPDPTEFLFVSLETKRQDQTKAYDGKTACWVPDEKEGFAQGLITATDGDLVTVKVNGEEKTFKKDLVGQVNPPKYEKCEDMSNLTYLNDASVLHNLRQRYYNKLIYTYSGLFCVAINPYKRYPIYTARCMAIYKGRRRNEVPPHLFAISDGAYMNMLTNQENQSMLITGESGAGKTENTKKVIAYLADVAATAKKEGKKVSLEDQIVQTNPVLEAFGNAKTTRNDNSSRFGKFIRIHFGGSGKLAGADIETYLLEKARVISQQPLERSYHIFYQLLSDTIPYMREMCVFEDFGVLDFKFVSQGKTTIPGVDDGEEMVATDEAFDILGFSKQEKEDVYRITATVMHMGEMKFKQKGREEQAEDDGTAEGERIGRLLGIGFEDLYKNFLKPRIKVGTEFVTKGQNLAQVLNNVGAMAKAIFDRLFKFLVKKCNETLDTKQARVHFIGVLDIAGFEIFDYNGFEQLCINFTNEKLQQFFNHHMFVLEQEEYQREGIDWVFMDFGMDLQACIELMEKPLGLFSILEEESMFPKATDQTFDDKLKAQHLGKSPSFQKPKPPKPGQVQAHFSIAHYAGTVPYNLTGWLEKNKDPINDTVVDQFKKGSNLLLVEIFADHPGQSGGKDDGKGARKKGAGFATVSSSYREQLNNLMATLKATSPHFIRCIIPNEFKTPGLVDAALVMHQLTCNGVLEGIRICRKGFPNRMVYPDFNHRYLILAPNEMKSEKSERDAAQACFDAIGLDKDKFRLGNTKVFFRAGVLGEMEEIRDDRLGKIITWLQSAIRGYISRRDSHTLQEQRKALQIVQNNLRRYMKLRCWPWWQIWIKLKPNIHIRDFEAELEEMQEKLAKAEEAVEEEEERRKEAEAEGVKLLAAKNEVLSQLDAQKNLVGNSQAVINKIQAQKNELSSRLSDIQKRLSQAEESRNQLSTQRQKLDKELAVLRKSREELSARAQAGSQDGANQEQQVNSLNDELAQQEELIRRLAKEKKEIQAQTQRGAEELQVSEDKVNYFNRVKAKLVSSLDELEESIEREKKRRTDIDKVKRKIEGVLRSTNDTAGDLEQTKNELDLAIQRKEKEVSALTAKLEDEQSVIARLQRHIKELQIRVDELTAQVETERHARTKAEKQRGALARELDELTERLEAAGLEAAGQIELNKKREVELIKLRREVDQFNRQRDTALANIHQRHNEGVVSMARQIDNLHELKDKAEKERADMINELNESRTTLDHLSIEKFRQEKINKGLARQVNEVSSKFEQVFRTMNDLDSSKKRVAFENENLARQLESAEAELAELSKSKVSLATQVADTKRIADEETRERATLFGKYRNFENDLRVLKEQLDDEADRKCHLQRLLAKASADAIFWRSKYEAEGRGRADELEETKRKLQARIVEAEETIVSLNQKAYGIEKSKQLLTAELEQTQSEATRARSEISQWEKKQRNFGKIIQEWELRVDDLAVELDASKKECRNYCAELIRLKAAYQDGQGELESVRRDNKNLAEEIKHVMDQIREVNRTLQEIEKGRRRLEIERDELASSVESAESTLAEEEAKTLRGQLDLVQARQDIERRIQEKEDEFKNTRKTQQRSLDSMKISLEAEIKGKIEATRIRQHLESDVRQLEIALDLSNKANGDAQRNIKRYQQELSDLRTQLEDQQRVREQVREAAAVADRRANAVANEVDESRTLLEQADRARRHAEQELHESLDKLQDMGVQTGFLSLANKKLQSQQQNLQADLESIMSEAGATDTKAKKALADTARLAEELRAEQEHAQNQERQRKNLENELREVQSKLSEAESNALKGGKQAISKLEARGRALAAELDAEQRRHAEVLKCARETDRRIGELASQVGEENQSFEKMQDLADKLQRKINSYTKKIAEAEEVAALNLAKFSKAQLELEQAESRRVFTVQATTLTRVETTVARSLSPF